MSRSRPLGAIVVVVAACVGCGNGPVEPAGDPLDSFLTGARGTAPAEGTIQYSDAACVAPDWTTLHPEEPTLTWPTFRLATIPDLVRSHALLELSATDSVVVLREPSFTEGLELEGPTVLAITTWSGSDDVECDGDTIAGLPVVRSHAYGIDDDEVFDAASAQADEVGIDSVGDLDVAVSPNSI